jgi:hypothetical protein
VYFLLDFACDADEFTAAQLAVVVMLFLGCNLLR